MAVENVPGSRRFVFSDDPSMCEKVPSAKVESPAREVFGKHDQGIDSHGFSSRILTPSSHSAALGNWPAISRIRVRGP